MSTSTIYVTGTHKQKDNYGCFGVGVLTGKAKKTKDYIGQFDSSSKTETQLNILIYAVALAVEDKSIEELNVITDFALIKNITDGTIDLWESNNWKKETGVKVSHADLWQEVFDLIQKFNITFTLVEENDKKMPLLAKKVATETRKKKNTTSLYEDGEAESPKAKAKEEVPTEIPKAEKEVTTPVQKSANTSTEIKDITPPTEEKSAETLTEKRVKSSTVSTTEITENILPQAEATDSTIKVDSELKKECEALFDELGLPLEVAVSLLLKHTLHNKGFDFQIRLND